MRIRNRSIFHAVGHGLFHTGSFRAGGNVFRYVIDCGVLHHNERIDREITLHQHEEDYNRHLNLLVISHLDEDHVCGINALLAGTDVIDLLVLPYLNPIERLMLFFSAPGGTDGYIDFIRNPAEYLQSICSIGQILYVPDAPDSGIGSGPDNLKESVKRDWEDKFDIGPFTLIAPKDQHYQDVCQVEEEFLERSTLDGALFSSDAKVYVQMGILFDFFAKHIEHPRLMRFANEIRGVLAGRKLEVALTDGDTLNDMRAAYERNAGNVNEASLCVSITGINDIQCWFGNVRLPFDTPVANYYVRVDSFIRGLNRFGYLFTGDISLRKRRIYQAFIERYHVYSDRITCICIPHHGSQNNWNMGIVDCFPHASYVVSSRAGDPAHPHLNVANCCEAHGRRRPILRSDETNEIRFVASLRDG